MSGVWYKPRAPVQAQPGCYNPEAPRVQGGNCFAPQGMFDPQMPRGTHWPADMQLDPDQRLRYMQAKMERSPYGQGRGYVQMSGQAPWTCEIYE